MQEEEEEEEVRRIKGMEGLELEMEGKDRWKVMRKKTER